MTTPSANPAQRLDDAAMAQIRAGVERLISEHFTQAQQRVEPFYQQHLASFGQISRRHWRHKSDVVKEAAALPRAAWRFVRRKPDSETELAKDQELRQQLIEELLQTPQLEQKIQRYLSERVSHYGDWLSQFGDYQSRYGEEALLQAVQQQLDKLTLPRDGSRELLGFMTIGLIGKGLGAKAGFGSSIGLGMALASSLYTAQQGFWGALWLKIAGTPAWVTTAGAIGGGLVTLLAVPLLGPVAEFGVNRLRGKKALYQLIQDCQEQWLEPGVDGINTASRIALCVQIMPDLLQLVRVVR